MNLALRIPVLFALAICLVTGSTGSANAALGQATLHWTAPGDDSTIGRAAGYDVRYSLSPITAANFSHATAVTGVPAPKTAGSPESLTVSGLTAGNAYYFAIKTCDEVPNWSAISNIVYATVRTTDTRTADLTLQFSPPWPNPARGSTRWSYSLPQDGTVEIEAFDAAGRHVRNVASGRRNAGQGSVDWDLRDDGGRAVTSGIYFVRASLGGQTWTKKLVIVR